MDEEQRKIKQALDLLAERYPDPKVSSNKSVGGSAEKAEKIQEEAYIRTGMKNGIFRYLIYEDCLFENVALTGSQFRSVTFRNTPLNGNSFACCDFYNVEFDGSGCKPFSANNFSLSSFEGCRFSDVQFISSGMLGSLFHNCCFQNAVFRSSTLEGTSFINSRMAGCDLSSVNVEFTRFAKTDLDGTRFPFYQFPYVIGAANYISTGGDSLTLRAGEKYLPLSEYRQQLDNLILYFLDKRDYFPICNLYIAKGAIPEAKRYLLDGISSALALQDFRKVRYFCQLALHHDILDEFTRQRIIRDLDEFLQAKDIPESRLNDYMTHVGGIRTMLQGGGSNSVSLHFNIKTNAMRDDPEGLEYVNTLLYNLNQALAQSEGQNGFQVTVANYCPYEIAVTVLSAVGSAASIASLIWMIIDATKKHRAKKNRVEIDVDTYRDYVGAKVDCLRADLLRLQAQYSQRRFSKYIEEVTQQLKTDLEELYSKDIVIFRVKNESPPEKP